MDISLSPSVERLLRLKIAEGMYDSLSEAINSTIYIALSGQNLPQEQLDMLNADIQKGIQGIRSSV